MAKQKKSPDKKSDDWFWKTLAVVGTAASVAGLIISLLK